MYHTLHSHKLSVENTFILDTEMPLGEAIILWFPAKK